MRHSDPLREHPLRPVLAPRSVAVVGASQDPTKRGHQVLRALQSRGFGGRIVPVNPRGGTILGLSVVEDLSELEAPVELAVVCTPAASTPDVLAACGQAGVPGALVLAVGFRELGEEGEALEARLRGAARAGGVRLVGPNTSGLLNLSIGLDLIGVPQVPRGRMALLTQSGNVTLALLKEAATRGSGGFSLCVGVGNESDIGFHEYLDYLAQDRTTESVLIHAEGFGAGRSFLETARKVSRRKPVVLLKGGRSEAGKRAARSHTGALGSGDAMVRSALRQGGVIRVDRSDELLPVGAALASQPPARRGSGVVILSDGGGQGTLASDVLSEVQVPLAPLSPLTRDRLRDLLGAAAGLGNPVDLAGAADRDPHVFHRALTIILEDPQVSAVLLVGLFGGYHLRFSEHLQAAEEATATEMARLARRSGIPLVVHSIFAEERPPPLRTLAHEGIPVIGSLETACRALAALWERGRPTRRPPRGAPSALRVDVPEGGFFERVRSEGRRLLLEPELRVLLERYRVPLVQGRYCPDPEQAHQVAEAMGVSPDRPLVAKVVSTSVTHKTEAGGVVLGLTSPEAVGSAVVGAVASVRDYAIRSGMEPGIRGVLLAIHLPPPVVELLVGVQRDPSFGPVLTVAAGGTRVELLADSATRILPVSRGELREMLDELRIAPLLNGYRGGSPVDRTPVVDLILRLGRFAMDHPELVEVELNPVFVYPSRALAVDGRGYLDDEGQSP